MEVIRKVTTSNIKSDFMVQNYYMKVPCALDISVLKDDLHHTAVVKTIKFGYTIEVTHHTTNDFDDDNDYCSTRQKCIIKEFNMHTFKDEIEWLYKYYYAENNFKPNTKVICFTRDLPEIYAFFKHEFKCEPFYIDNLKLASVLLNGFLELRDISTITGKSYNESLDFCTYSIYTDYEENCACVNLLKYAEWYYINCCTETSAPLTIQQIINHEFKSLMTDDDKILVRNLFPENKTSYLRLKQHACIGALITYNPANCSIRNEYVGHRDFVSSYSTRILLERYPMTPFIKVDSFDEVNNGDCFLIDITLENFKAKTNGLFITTKCALELEDYTVANLNRAKDKVKTAKKIRLLLCDVDYDSLNANYTYNNYTINAIYTSESDKLPMYIRKPTEELFIQKCILDKDSLERSFVKMKLEVIYGSMIKGIYTKNKDGSNKSWDNIRNQSTTSPYWGIWTLAYARAALIQAINLINDDFICSHTDSIFYTNPNYNDKLIKYINTSTMNLVKDYAKHDCCLLRFKKYYEQIKDLGQLQDEEEDIYSIEVKSPNSLIYLGKDGITTKVGGLQKHFIKDGKLVNVIEYNSDKYNIFNNFCSRHKWHDYRDRYIDSDDHVVIYKDGFMYSGTGYRYKWREETHLSEDEIYLLQQKQLELEEQYKDECSKLRVF